MFKCCNATILCSETHAEESEQPLFVFTYFHHSLKLSASTPFQRQRQCFSSRCLKGQGCCTTWQCCGVLPTVRQMKSCLHTIWVYGAVQRSVLTKVTLQSLKPLVGGFPSVHLPFSPWLPVVWLMFAQQHPVCIHSHFPVKTLGQRQSAGGTGSSSVGWY